MKKLAVILSEYEYSTRLSEYLINRIDQEYMVIVYSQIEKIVKDISDGKIAILLTDEEMYESIIQCEHALEDSKNAIINKNIEKVICLSEEKVKENSEGQITYVYKYLPVSKIVADESLLLKKNKEISTNTSNLTGIYSPIGGIGVSSFSILYAKLAGRGKSVLFITLEPYSAVNEELSLEDKNTLSELIYEFTSQSAVNIEKYIQNTEDINVISPIKSVKELFSIHEDIWIDFIKYLTSIKDYEEVIIEFSDAVEGLNSILGICDKLLVPYRRGRIYGTKIDLFKKELEKEIPDSYLKEKIKYVEVPTLTDQEDSYENIDTSILGRWLERLYDGL